MFRLAPSAPDTLVPTIEKAWEAKIPVVPIDVTIAGNGARYHPAILATQNKKADELRAKAPIDEIGTGVVMVTTEDIDKPEAKNVVY